MSSIKRHFKVIIGNKEHGLYTSSTPSSAAKKAVSKLCANNKNKKVEFSLRETTQESNKKIYGPYIGYMQKLDKPVELEGRVIHYKPIAKRNNQVGGSFKVGDHVRTLNLELIRSLAGRENRYIIIKVVPEKSTYIIRHINGGPDINSAYFSIKKIDSNPTPAASAASAASTASAAPISNQKSPNFFQQLSQHNNTKPAIKKGDHVKCISKKIMENFPSLFFVENEWIVEDILSNSKSIKAVHEYSGVTLNIPWNEVEKIDSNPTPAASAASAASTASAAPISNQKSPNFFEQLSQHRNTNDSHLGNWNVVRNPQSPVIVRKPRKPRKQNSNFFMVESSNNNSPVLL